MATFGAGKLRVDVPFTSDAAALRQAARTWEGFGTTALHDAVASLPAIVRDRASTKRAALLVTDGIDNASAIDAASARQSVHDAELPVYVLGLAGTDAEGRGAETLRSLAHLSGGRYYSIRERGDLQTVCVDVLADLRHQYVLGFATSGAPETPHRLRVEVRQQADRVVTARRSYTGGSPAAPAQSGAKSTAG